MLLMVLLHDIAVVAMSLWVGNFVVVVVLPVVLLLVIVLLVLVVMLVFGYTIAWVVFGVVVVVFAMTV